MTDSDRLSENDLPVQIINPRAAAEAPSPLASRLKGPENDQMEDSTQDIDHSACEDSQLLLDNVIKRTLIRSLEQTQGNRRRAADLLGVSRSTLYRMLARYELCEKPGGCEEIMDPTASRGDSILRQ